MQTKIKLASISEGSKDESIFCSTGVIPFSTIDNVYLMPNKPVFIHTGLMLESIDSLFPLELHIRSNEECVLKDGLIINTTSISDMNNEEISFVAVWTGSDTNNNFKIEDKMLFIPKGSHIADGYLYPAAKEDFMIEY